MSAASRSPTNSNHSWHVQTSLWCDLPVHSKSSNGGVLCVLKPRSLRRASRMGHQHQQIAWMRLYKSLDAASNGHVLAFDNVSGLPAWISDTLCRLAAGGGFAVRQLYTDQDEVLFDAARPVT